MQSKENLTQCKHENAYYNIISRTLKFWVCPSCKQELPPEIPESQKTPSNNAQSSTNILDYYPQYYQEITSL